MQIQLNGQPAELGEACSTVGALIAERLWTGRAILVELNGEVVLREDYGSTALADGDRIEVVHFVGGG